MHTVISNGITRLTGFALAGLILLCNVQVFASGPDEWRGKKGGIILQNWSLNLTLGFTSYYGDLSQYDGNYVEKLIFESKPAVGLKLTKFFHPVIGIAGQLIYGGLRSDFLPEHTFDMKLLEYNVQATIDPTPILFPGRSMPWGLEVSAGVGQFKFQTIVGGSSGELQQSASLMSGTPEFVYFFGGTFYYAINQRLRFTTDLSIRQAQNDNIDKYIASKDFDYYSWFAVGISWSINSTFSVKRYRATNKVNKHPPLWRK